MNMLGCTPDYVRVCMYPRREWIHGEYLNPSPHTPLPSLLNTLTTNLTNNNIIIINNKSRIDKRERYTHTLTYSLQDGQDSCLLGGSS